MERERIDALEVVYETHEPTEACIDVVAVHGLNGHPHQSWTADCSGEAQYMWLKDTLPKYVSDLRVMVFDYNSASTGPKSLLAVDGLKHSARLLVRSLASKRSKTQTKNRSIIFISHDLGGVLVKAALIDAATGDSTSSIASNTRRLIFFGTPHHAADGISWGDLISDIFFATQLSTPFVGHFASTIETLGKHVKDISNEFVSSTLRRTTKWINVYQNVERQSSEPVSVTHNAFITTSIYDHNVAREASHQNLCRFTEESNVSEVMNVFTAESQEGYSECVATLLELSPPVSLSWYSERGCTTDISNLQHQPDYKEWLASSKPSALKLFLRGNELGESNFSGSLVRSLREQFFVAYYSFTGTDPRRSSAISALSSLICQVLNTCPQRFCRIGGLYKSLKDQSLWTKGSLARLFKSLLESNGDNTFKLLLVIENPTNDPCGDSLLEELTENDRNNHGNLILAPIIVCEENPNSVNTNSRHTYIHLQTSTSWAEKTKSLIPEILDRIIDQQPYLSGFLADIQAALEKCQSSLQFWLTIWSLREQLRSPQLNRISFGSKLQYLPDNTLFATIKIYYSLPVWAKKALSWVLHARRPLKVKELAAALLIDRIDQKKIILPSKDCVFLDLPIELERVFGSFLKSENDEISVAREGLAPLFRKIVSSDTRTSTCSSEFNKITSKPDEIPNDWIITRTLLKYLSDERVLCNIKDTLAKGVWKPSEDPLCDLVEYAVQYWHEHYQETLQDPLAESYAEEVFQLLGNMSLTQILWELNTHLRRDSLPAAFGIRDPLCLAARFGLIGFIRKFQVPTKIREDKSLEAIVTQPVSDTAGNLRTTTDKYLYIEIACWEGHLDIVKLLVGHDQVKNPQDLTKSLKCASLRGHNVVVQYLVDKIRTSQGSFDWDHELVLRAAEIGYESQVVLFVDSGATPDAEYGGITPLQLATRNGHSSIVQFLLSKGADPSSAHAEDLNKPIHYAVEQGHFSVLDQLLKVHAKVTIRNGQGRTPLHLASQQGDFDILKRLLGHFDLTPVSHSHSGRAALDYRRMAFLDAADNLGNTSLHLASAKGHTAVVEFLLGQGAKLDLANTEGVTALWTSVKHRHELTAESIVSNANSTTEFSDIGKVIFEAARLGYVVVVRLALQKGFLAAEDLKSSDQLGCTALHYAAQNGRGAILKFLIEQDLDIGQRNNEHDTPLILAACAGKPDAVRTLLSLLRLDRDAYVDQNSDISTLVVRIAKMDGISTSPGHADVVKTLLLENADPNGADSFSRTALHYAAQHGNLMITQALLQFGADSALKDREGRNSLHFAAFNGWTAITKLLLTTEVDPLEADLGGRTPMHLAAMKDAPDILDLLWRTKPELLELEAFNNQTPLHAASDKAMCTKWLLQHEANINAQDSNGQTPLMLAVEHGDLDVVEQLLGKNAKVTLKDTKQWTALHYAALHGQWTTGQKILDQDIAAINVADQTKRSALHIAIIENRDKFAYGLLGERFGPKLELDLQDSNGDSPLILAVRRSSEQILEALLRLGANTELRNKRGETVLVAAVRERKQVIIKILLEPSRNNKAKINGGGGKAEPTALYAAATAGRRDIVDLLLGFDADVNSPGGMCNTPLVAAAQGGWVSLVKLLLSRGATVSQGGGIYANALCAAIVSGTLDLVDDLIESASVINQPDEQGRTSMHWAAWRGSWILLEHLMGKGGNPFVRDLQQRTLIHHAVMGGDVDMIEKLLSDEKTKELYLKDLHGWTPLHWACRLEHNRSMVKSLVQHLDDHQKSELAEPILHHWTPEIIAIFHDNMNILELIPKIWTEEQSERDWAVGSPHSGFTCDGCQLKPIYGLRWRCLKCEDFDFCFKCYWTAEDTHPGHDFGCKGQGPEKKPITKRTRKPFWSRFFGKPRSKKSGKML